MKRWIRRILLSLSIALMVAAVGLTLRGFFVTDVYVSNSFIVMSRLSGAGVDRTWRGSSYADLFMMELGWTSVLPDVAFWTGFDFVTGQGFLPTASFRPTGFWIPHWIVFLLGGAWPGSLWLRHLKF